MFGLALVALAACGGQTWSTGQAASSSSTPPARTDPTVVVPAVEDGAIFCDRLADLADAMSSAMPSPTAATVVADASAVAALVHDAPPKVRGSVEIVAAAFAKYAGAVRHAGPDPSAQANAIIGTALSLDGRRFTAAYAALREYARNTCHIELGAQRDAVGTKLESIDVDAAIRHDKRFWTLPVSTSVATIMGSTTVAISASTLDRADSLAICQDVAPIVYAKAPTAVIEVGSSTQPVYARATGPGACVPSTDGP